jgi:hypothetical protein
VFSFQTRLGQGGDILNHDVRNLAGLLSASVEGTIVKNKKTKDESGNSLATHRFPPRLR